MRGKMTLAVLAAALLLVAVTVLSAGPRRPAAALQPTSELQPAAPAAGLASDPPAHGGAPRAPGASIPTRTPPEPDGDTDPMSGHPQAVDPYTRAVLSYPVTMRRFEAYVEAVKEIRMAATRDAAMMAQLRVPSPPEELPAGVAARLETCAPLKAILDHRGLDALDLVLMPRVVYAGRNAFALEQEGRPLPPGEMNAAAAALFRDDLPRMDALVKAFQADLRVLSGR
jgi:hypothetical protein